MFRIKYHSQLIRMIWTSLSESMRINPNQIFNLNQPVGRLGLRRINSFLDFDSDWFALVLTQISEWLDIVRIGSELLPIRFIRNNAVISSQLLTNCYPITDERICIILLVEDKKMHLLCSKTNKISHIDD